MKRRALLSALALSLASVGCSHRLEIKNLSEYRATSINVLPKKISIGIATTEEDVTIKRLLHDVGTELQKYAGEVVMPYAATDEKKVDLIADIRITPDYRGSGANFLVNFPGFLVWAPAWHGYNYHVTYKVDVALISGADNTKFDEFSLPITLNIRQAELDRTWTEVGWFEVGLIPFIGGFHMISYDQDITPKVAEASGPTIGEYVGNEIVARINASGRFALLPDGTIVVLEG